MYMLKKVTQQLKIFINTLKQTNTSIFFSADFLAVIAIWIGLLGVLYFFDKYY